jgi:hypothetical protein
MAGFGGRDVPPEQIVEMVERASTREGKKEEFYMIGIRE